MPNPLRSATPLCLLLAIVSTGCSQPRNAADIYGQYCANCHGMNLEGGSAPSMLDEEWAHGGTDEDIARQIAQGNLEKGMPAWESVFSSAEIRALVVYIRERRAGYERNRETLPTPASDLVLRTRDHTFRIETVTDAVDQPWALNWLPNGTLLITEKPGTLRFFRNGEVNAPIMDTPWVDPSGQAGLLDVAPHPDYATNGWLYLSFSDPQVNAAGDNVSFTKVVRGRVRDGTWVDEQVIDRKSVV